MQYRNTISSMQAMLDIMTGLRKIRERIPVREAVSGVLNDRREFVRRCPSILRFDIRVSDTRGYTDLGILRVHLVVRLRTCLQGAPASATVPPFYTARAHHAHFAHRADHARF
jgi:hypothetical protein